MTRMTKIIGLTVSAYALTLASNLLIGGIGVVLGRNGVWEDSTMSPLLSVLFVAQVALFLGTFALGYALGETNHE